MQTYPVRLGSTVALFVRALSGDPTTATAPAAFIRRMLPDRSDYDALAPSIPMTVAFQAAAGGQPAGWHVSILAAAPQFSEGHWGVDFWINVGAAKPSLERAVVHLRKAAGP